VLIDGVQSPASVSEDANFWYVHVTYMHSQHYVTIGGSNTVPEFPSLPPLVILVLLSSIILWRVERKDLTLSIRLMWIRFIPTTTSQVAWKQDDLTGPQPWQLFRE
jgi:hypothetical protein